MRPKLTYANVVATLALFIALGGASYAALKLPKNSVGAKQLKKNAVATAKIKNAAVNGAKVKDDSLTGKDIDESSLGAVPSANQASSADTAGSANTLQGTGPDGFVNGRGAVFVARRDLESGETHIPLFEIPGVGVLTAICESGSVGYQFANTSNDAFDIVKIELGRNIEEMPVGGEFGATGSSDSSVDFQLSNRSHPSYTILSIQLRKNDPKACGISAVATKYGP